MSNIVIITGSEATRITIAEQLLELFDHKLEIDSYSTDIGIPHHFSNSIVVITSTLIIDECSEYIDDSCKVIVARRTLNLSRLERIYQIPKGRTVLIANDTFETACEVRDLLVQVGFSDYEYVPFFPGCKLKDYAYDYIITPGETFLLGSNIHNLIDIGSRILDITTIVEILQLLGLLDEKAHMVSAKYIRTILSQEKELVKTNQEIQQANEFMTKLINSVNDGIVSFNKNGLVKLVNSTASKLLKLYEGDNLFLAVSSLQRLTAFLHEESLNNSLIELNGHTYMFTKDYNQTSHSYLLTINDVRERINLESSLRKELRKQGYYAKHSFSSLVFQSEIMYELIAKSKRLAHNEFSILIFGESGTGKELFASAIHNESDRREGPFLAVNFSSLPDDLIESELFGYEEGAFTGAKKGGKTGLFELANGGTIFLDEIGDISPKIQSRLLRVLQEKEILRVGGSRIIPINARVIAATNKNLTNMVENGLFREDLYYRLKKLYINIPPLRDRKEDLLPLFNHMMLNKSDTCLPMTEATKRLLLDYDWPGNVRELENTVEYVLAVNEESIIGTGALPEDLTAMARKPGFELDEISTFLLIKIYEHNLQNLLIGRKKLSELAYENRLPYTEQQIRGILDQLELMGFLSKGKGKIGLRLLDKGVRFCKKQIK